MLQLALRDCNTFHLEAFYTLSGQCYAATTISSGQATDMVYDATNRQRQEPWTVDFYQFWLVLGGCCATQWRWPCNCWQETPSTNAGRNAAAQRSRPAR